MSGAKLWEQRPGESFEHCFEHYCQMCPERIPHFTVMSVVKSQDDILDLMENTEEIHMNLMIRGKDQCRTAPVFKFRSRCTPHWLTTNQQTFQSCPTSS